MIPLLPTLAQSMASGFEASREGCFLWATDAVVREFSEGAELVDHSTSSAVFQFYEQQAIAFLRILNDLPPEQLPDGKHYPGSYHWLGFALANGEGGCFSDRGLFPPVVGRRAVLSQGMHIVISSGAHLLRSLECSYTTAG